MKLLKSISIIFALSSLIYAHELDHPTKKIIININNSNQAQLNTSILNNPPSVPLETLDSAKNVVTFWNKLPEFNWQHKVGILATTLVAAYCTLCTTLWYKNYNINHKNVWGTWHTSVPLDELKKIPTSDLAQKLYQAILTEYAQHPLQYDFLTPIIAFLQDVELEQQRIDSYRHLYSWLKKLGISFFLPNNNSKVAAAFAQQERLEFLKQTLLSWMRSDQKVVG